MCLEEYKVEGAQSYIRTLNTHPLFYLQLYIKATSSIESRPLYNIATTINTSIEPHYLNLSFLNMPPKDKYTDPKLRDEVKEEIHQGDKGGAPGQWSARKAQMMASEYKKRGGGVSKIFCPLLITYRA